MSTDTSHGPAAVKEVAEVEAGEPSSAAAGALVGGPDVAASPADATGQEPGASQARSAPDGPTVAWCPHCGAPLDVESFVQEYWTANTRAFHCWCRACAFVAEVAPTERVVTHEPAHDE